MLDGTIERLVRHTTLQKQERAEQEKGIKECRDIASRILNKYGENVTHSEWIESPRDKNTLIETTIITHRRTLPAKIKINGELKDLVIERRLRERPNGDAPDCIQILLCDPTPGNLPEKILYNMTNFSISSAADTELKTANQFHDLRSVLKFIEKSLEPKAVSKRTRSLFKISQIITKLFSI